MATTMNINNMLQNNIDFMEPPPSIIVSEFDATNDYSIVVTAGTYTNYNVHEVVRMMFDELALENVIFEFNPSSATWNCSYFPQDYIAEVAFMFRLYHQNGVILIEKVYLSGHLETYNELCNSIVGRICDFMNHSVIHSQ